MVTQPQPFIRAGLLHVPRQDPTAGETVTKLLIQSLHRVVIQQESYAASDRRWLEDTLCKWCDEDELDLVVTIGGTYPAPGSSTYEIVPEATLAVLERLVPGLAETMRAYVREEFPAVSLHRGVAGIRGRSLIVNLPSGAEVASIFLEAILEDLPYILAHLRGDADAVTLAQIIGEGDAQGGIQASDSERENLAETKPAKPSGKGLNAEEFAAFLRRRKSGEA